MFLEVVEKADPGLVSTLWLGPEHLPSIEEIRDPQRWLARVQASELPQAEAAAN